MEVLVVIVIAVLVLGVAIGPLLAMRNPAEADKLTPGADPAGESSRSRTPAKAPSSRQRPGTPRISRSYPRGGPEYPGGWLVVPSETADRGLPDNPIAGGA